MTIQPLLQLKPLHDKLEVDVAVLIHAAYFAVDVDKTERGIIGEYANCGLRRRIRAGI
jgi:hypothetical protein